VASTTNKSRVAVVIGRFEPFHLGHKDLVDRALAFGETVIVVLGSAFHARSAKNPFTWQERAAMIGQSYPETERSRLIFIGMRDYYDDTRWADAVRKAVEARASGNDVQLFGYAKDATSHYLDWFPDWKFEAIEQRIDLDATTLRKVYFEAENMDVSLAVIESMMPSAVTQYLKAWAKLPFYADAVAEHKSVESYRAKWAAAPYTPVLVTVDAVVRVLDHVLLVRRKAYPGKGLWALPGGFVEPAERLLPAAIRELREETGLGAHDSLLTTGFQKVVVFDHPGRSTRMRTITHAHYFDLRLDKLPEVSGQDDAEIAVWTPLKELASLEDKFFDDHFHILDHFFGVTAN
jgi:bifunctional NMN adenylyltransferase/nudix hydrolase